MPKAFLTSTTRKVKKESGTFYFSKAPFRLAQFHQGQSRRARCHRGQGLQAASLPAMFRLALYPQGGFPLARFRRGRGLQAASHQVLFLPAQCHLVGWYQAPGVLFSCPRIFRTLRFWDSWLDRWRQRNYMPAKQGR